MKSKLVKKLLVGSLAVTMVFGLAACGGDGSSTDASIQTIESYPLENSAVMDGNVPDSTVQPNTGATESVESSEATTVSESSVSELSETEGTDVAVMNGEDSAVLTGIWQLDNVKNDSAVLETLFGSGLEEGNSLELKEDGMFSYYIGIDVGGDGTYEQTEDTVTANVTTYMDQIEEAVQLQVQQEEGQTYLVMDYNGETLYWSQSE